MSTPTRCAAASRPYTAGPVPARPAAWLPRRFVYILRSDSNPDRHYVGLTADVERRLHWHNHGPSGVTVRHRPWSLVVAIEFADASAAWRFERYLKSGSGRAFAKRHFGDGNADT